jgi:hypothetical protein
MKQENKFETVECWRSLFECGRSLFEISIKNLAFERYLYFRDKIGVYILNDNFYRLIDFQLDGTLPPVLKILDISKSDYKELLEIREFGCDYKLLLSIFEKRSLKIIVTDSGFFDLKEGDPQFWKEYVSDIAAKARSFKNNNKKSIDNDNSLSYN